MSNPIGPVLSSVSSQATLTHAMFGVEIVDNSTNNEYVLQSIAREE